MSLRATSWSDTRAVPLRSIAQSTAAAFLAALLLRLAAIAALGHYQDPTLWENGVIARYLLEGCGFCMDFSRAGELSSWQAPAYPTVP
ncbi:MAG: hypothetical protein IMZ55_01100, partial [Acidobacteria bacterium]|nr:hypothetical protein [Acidobacteriota bacterium]